jgi:hypothetical protein
MTCCLLFVIILTTIVILLARNNDKVKLVDIDTLTFVSGRHTTARRGRPLLQLECVRGNCNDESSSLLPVTVQCRNMGTDGIDVQWKCDAELDNRVKFGELEVSCEGYDNPDDPYVLKGSCRLEYELLRVGWPRRVRDDESGISWFWILVLVGVTVCVLRVCCRQSTQNEHQILPPHSIQSPQYGNVRSPDDPLPSYDQATAPNPNAGVGAGTLPSMMSHAAAGAAGFALGRATAPTVSPMPTPYFHQTTTTTYENTSNSNNSNKDGSSSSSTRPATGFATTKRR